MAEPPPPPPLRLADLSGRLAALFLSSAGGQGGRPLGPVGPERPWIAFADPCASVAGPSSRQMPPASRWMPGPGTGPSRGQERETMTTAAAGMDVRGKTPDIHPTGGTGPPPATPTACAGPPASRGRRRGAGRHGGHGADAPGRRAAPAGGKRCAEPGSGGPQTEGKARIRA